MKMLKSLLFILIIIFIMGVGKREENGGKLEVDITKISSEKIVSHIGKVNNRHVLSFGKKAKELLKDRMIMPFSRGMLEKGAIPQKITGDFKRAYLEGIKELGLEKSQKAITLDKSLEGSKEIYLASYDDGGQLVEVYSTTPKAAPTPDFNFNYHTTIHPTKNTNKDIGYPYLGMTMEGISTMGFSVGGYSYENLEDEKLRTDYDDGRWSREMKVYSEDGTLLADLEDREVWTDSRNGIKFRAGQATSNSGGMGFIYVYDPIDQMETYYLTITGYLSGEEMTYKIDITTTVVGLNVGGDITIDGLINPSGNSLIEYSRLEKKYTDLGIENSDSSYLEDSVVKINSYEITTSVADVALYDKDQTFLMFLENPGDSYTHGNTIVTRGDDDHFSIKSFSPSVDEFYLGFRGDVNYYTSNIKQAIQAIDIVGSHEVTGSVNPSGHILTTYNTVSGAWETQSDVVGGSDYYVESNMSSDSTSTSNDGELIIFDGTHKLIGIISSTETGDVVDGGVTFKRNGNSIDILAHGGAQGTYYLQSDEKVVKFRVDVDLVAEITNVTTDFNMIGSLPTNGILKISNGEDPVLALEMPNLSLIKTNISNVTKSSGFESENNSDSNLDTGLSNKEVRKLYVYDSTGINLLGEFNPNTPAEEIEGVEFFLSSSNRVLIKASKAAQSEFVIHVEGDTEEFAYNLNVDVTEVPLNIINDTTPHRINGKIGGTAYIKVDSKDNKWLTDKDIQLEDGSYFNYNTYLEEETLAMGSSDYYLYDEAGNYLGDVSFTGNKLVDGSIELEKIGDGDANLRVIGITTREFIIGSGKEAVRFTVDVEQAGEISPNIHSLHGVIPQELVDEGIKGVTTNGANGWSSGQTDGFYDTGVDAQNNSTDRTNTPRGNKPRTSVEVYDENGILLGTIIERNNNSEEKAIIIDEMKYYFSNTNFTMEALVAKSDTTYVVGNMSSGYNYINVQTTEGDLNITQTMDLNGRLSPNGKLEMKNINNVWETTLKNGDSTYNEKDESTTGLTADITSYFIVYDEHSNFIHKFDSIGGTYSDPSNGVSFTVENGTKNITIEAGVGVEATYYLGSSTFTTELTIDTEAAQLLPSLDKKIEAKGVVPSDEGVQGFINLKNIVTGWEVNTLEVNSGFLSNGYITVDNSVGHSTAGGAISLRVYDATTNEYLGEVDASDEVELVNDDLRFYMRNSTPNIEVKGPVTGEYILESYSASGFIDSVYLEVDVTEVDLNIVNDGAPHIVRGRLTDGSSILTINNASNQWETQVGIQNGDLSFHENNLSPVMTTPGEKGTSLYLYDSNKNFESTIENNNGALASGTKFSVEVANGIGYLHAYKGAEGTYYVASGQQAIEFEFNIEPAPAFPQASERVVIAGAVPDKRELGAYINVENTVSRWESNTLNVNPNFDSTGYETKDSTQGFSVPSQADLLIIYDANNNYKFLGAVHDTKELNLGETRFYFSDKSKETPNVEVKGAASGNYLVEAYDNGNHKYSIYMDIAVEEVALPAESGTHNISGSIGGGAYIHTENTAIPSNGWSTTEAIQDGNEYANYNSSDLFSAGPGLYNYLYVYDAVTKDYLGHIKNNDPIFSIDGVKIEFTNGKVDLNISNRAEKSILLGSATSTMLFNIDVDDATNKKHVISGALPNQEIETYIGVKIVGDQLFSSTVEDFPWFESTGYNLKDTSDSGTVFLNTAKYRIIEETNGRILGEVTDINPIENDSIKAFFDGGIPKFYIKRGTTDGYIVEALDQSNEVVDVILFDIDTQEVALGPIQTHVVDAYVAGGAYVETIGTIGAAETQWTTDLSIKDDNPDYASSINIVETTGSTVSEKVENYIFVYDNSTGDYLGKIDGDSSKNFRHIAFERTGNDIIMGVYGQNQDKYILSTGTKSIVFDFRVFNAPIVDGTTSTFSDIYMPEDKALDVKFILGYTADNGTNNGEWEDITDTEVPYFYSTGYPTKRGNIEEKKSVLKDAIGFEIVVDGISKGRIEEGGSQELIVQDPGVLGRDGEVKFFYDQSGRPKIEVTGQVTKGFEIISWDNGANNHIYAINIDTRVLRKNKLNSNNTVHNITGRLASGSSRILTHNQSGGSWDTDPIILNSDTGYNEGNESTNTTATMIDGYTYIYDGDKNYLGHIVNNTGVGSSVGNIEILGTGSRVEITAGIGNDSYTIGSGTEAITMDILVEEAKALPQETLVLEGVVPDNQQLRAYIAARNESTGWIVDTTEKKPHFNSTGYNTEDSSHGLTIGSNVPTELRVYRESTREYLGKIDGVENEILLDGNMIRFHTDSHILAANGVPNIEVRGSLNDRYIIEAYQGTNFLYTSFVDVDVTETALSTPQGEHNILGNVGGGAYLLTSNTLAPTGWKTDPDIQNDNNYSNYNYSDKGVTSGPALNNFIGVYDGDTNQYLGHLEDGKDVLYSEGVVFTFDSGIALIKVAGATKRSFILGSGNETMKINIDVAKATNITHQIAGSVPSNDLVKTPLSSTLSGDKWKDTTDRDKFNSTGYPVENNTTVETAFINGEEYIIWDEDDRDTALKTLSMIEPEFIHNNVRFTYVSGDLKIDVAGVTTEEYFIEAADGTSTVIGNMVVDIDVTEVDLAPITEVHSVGGMVDGGAHIEVVGTGVSNTEWVTNMEVQNYDSTTNEYISFVHPKYSDVLTNGAGFKGYVYLYDSQGALLGSTPSGSGIIKYKDLDLIMNQGQATIEVSGEMREELIIGSGRESITMSFEVIPSISEANIETHTISGKIEGTTKLRARGNLNGLKNSLQNVDTNYFNNVEFIGTTPMGVIPNNFYVFDEEKKLIDISNTEIIHKGVRIHKDARTGDILIDVEPGVENHFILGLGDLTNSRIEAINIDVDSELASSNPHLSVTDATYLKDENPVWTLDGSDAYLGINSVVSDNLLIKTIAVMNGRIGNYPKTAVNAEIKVDGVVQIDTSIPTGTVGYDDAFILDLDVNNQIKLWWTDNETVEIEKLSWNGLLSTEIEVTLKDADLNHAGNILGNFKLGLQMEKATGLAYMEHQAREVILEYGSDVDLEYGKVGIEDYFGEVRNSNGVLELKSTGKDGIIDEIGEEISMESPLEITEAIYSTTEGIYEDVTYKLNKTKQLDPGHYTIKESENGNLYKYFDPYANIWTEVAIEKEFYVKALGNNEELCISSGFVKGDEVTLWEDATNPEWVEYKADSNYGFRVPEPFDGKNVTLNLVSGGSYNFTIDSNGSSNSEVIEIGKTSIEGKFENGIFVFEILGYSMGEDIFEFSIFDNNEVVITTELSVLIGEELGELEVISGNVLEFERLEKGQVATAQASLILNMIVPLTDAYFEEESIKLENENGGEILETLLFTDHVKNENGISTVNIRGEIDVPEDQSGGIYRGSVNLVLEYDL